MKVLVPSLLLLTLLALLTPPAEANVCCIECYVVDNTYCFYCSICGCTPDGPYNSCSACHCFSFTSIKEALLREDTEDEKIMKRQYKMQVAITGKQATQ